MFAIFSAIGIISFLAAVIYLVTSHV
jgi:hypothetical protein